MVLAIVAISVFGAISFKARHHPIRPLGSIIKSSPVTVTDDPHFSLPTRTEIASAKRAVPILMYHYIRTVTNPKDTLGFNLSVTPAHFEEQMTWLADHQYHTMPLDDFCNGKTLVQNPVILTFDDGYNDAYTDALPTLQKHGFMGTFFIVSGFVNQPGYITTAELSKLAEAYMELGAHTVKHIDLAQASIARQEQEIGLSKQITPVFAYPAGRYTPDTIKIVQKDGYSCAVTTHYGIATEKSPLYELPRVRISGGDRLGLFRKKVTGEK